MLQISEGKYSYRVLYFSTITTSSSYMVSTQVTFCHFLEGKIKFANSHQIFVISWNNTKINRKSMHIGTNLSVLNFRRKWHSIQRAESRGIPSLDN